MKDRARWSGYHALEVGDALRELVGDELRELVGNDGTTNDMTTGTSADIPNKILPDDSRNSSLLKPPLHL
jgi:hypothetical protein